MTDISPKVVAGGVGAAAATIFWIIATSTFWKDQFNEAELSALTGSTAVVLSFLFGYLIRDPARNRLMLPPSSDAVTKEYVDRNQDPPQPPPVVGPPPHTI